MSKANKTFSFQITSGKITLSDPCYTPDDPDSKIKCGEYNIPAKNGNWIAEVEYMPNCDRVKSFSARLIDTPYFAQHIIDTEFGVDSGQFGIFDSSIYEPGDYDEPGFYRDCCDITMSEDMCGDVYGLGFVSSSGWGDGGYYGTASYNPDTGEMVSFEIDFCPTEEDWDEYDDGYGELDDLTDEEIINIDFLLNKEVMG